MSRPLSLTLLAALLLALLPGCGGGQQDRGINEGKDKPPPQQQSAW